MTTGARARWLGALTQDVRRSIFSLINGLLLREFPVEEPHRLATISSAMAIQRGQLAGFGWNYAMWERFRDRAHAFAGALGWRPRRLNLGRGGETTGGRVYTGASRDRVRLEVRTDHSGERRTARPSHVRRRDGDRARVAG